MDLVILSRSAFKNNSSVEMDLNPLIECATEKQPFIICLLLGGIEIYKFYKIGIQLLNYALSL